MVCRTWSFLTAWFERPSSLTQRLLLWATLLIVLIELYHCSILLRAEPGIDLRNRIVGARALAAGIDPYDQAAISGNGLPSPEFLDPLSIRLGFSANTAPPTVLDVYRLYMRSPWQNLHIFWAAMEWIILLIACSAFIFCTKPTQYRSQTAFIFSITIIASKFWIFDNIVGEYYVWIAGLLAVDSLLIWHGTKRGVGLLTGMAMALRPPLMLMLPLLWLLKRRDIGWRAGGLAGLLLLASLLGQTQAWISFSKNVERWALYQGEQSESPILTPETRAKMAIALAKDGYPFDPETWQRAEPRKSLPPEQTGHFGSHWRLKALLITIVVMIAAAATALRCRPAKNEGVTLILAWLPPLLDLATPVRHIYNEIFFLPGIGVVTLLAATHLTSKLPLFIALLALAVSPFGQSIDQLVGFRYFTETIAFHLMMVYGLVTLLRTAPPSATDASPP